jgi:hypothetical protein
MPTLLLRFASGWLTDGLSISKYIFKSPTCLFLLLGLGVSGVLGSLGSDSGVSLGGSGHSEGSVCVLLLGLGRDGSGLGLGSLLDNGEGSRGGEDLDGGLGLVGLTLLELSGEDNQLGLVLLESQNVGLKTLNGSVLSSVVNGNTNGSSVVSGDTGSLELLKRETSASSDLSVVSDSGGSDNRSEKIQRSGSDSSGLLGSCKSSRRLLAGLVKVGLDPLLPVLSEMVLDEGVVLTDS